MLDGRGRSIDYLRVSVTDRCNLRCVYCMPEDGVPSLRHGEILRYEEIARVVRVMAGLGIRHVRLTGGEPMARRGCLGLVRTLAETPGIESVSMTSNGLLLGERMDEAKRAGLRALNLSLDTLDAAAYARLTRGGSLSQALSALDRALALGLSVKLNAVPVRGFNDDGLEALASLAREKPVCVRFIELMPLGCARALRPVPEEEVLARLTDAFGPPEEDAAPHGHGPARYVRFPGFVGSVGFISPISCEFCARCNRVRLTAEGQLKLCLNHAGGPDLRALLRGSADDAALADAIRRAVAEKPARHAFDEELGDREARRMNEIGG